MDRLWLIIIAAIIGVIASAQPVDYVPPGDFCAIANGRTDSAVCGKERLPPAGSLAQNNQQGLDSGKKEYYIKLAFDKAKTVMQIKDATTATIKTNGDIVIVTFPFPHDKRVNQPPFPDPDYLARVKIDRLSGKIIEILGAE